MCDTSHQPQDAGHHANMMSKKTGIDQVRKYSQGSNNRSQSKAKKSMAVFLDHKVTK